jgi:hypothetical protein
VADFLGRTADEHREQRERDTGRDESKGNRQLGQVRHACDRDGRGRGGKRA